MHRSPRGNDETDAVPAGAAGVDLRDTAASAAVRVCKPCRDVGMVHCAYPDECGGPWSDPPKPKVTRYAASQAHKIAGPYGHVSRVKSDAETFGLLDLTAKFAHRDEPTFHVEPLHSSNPAS